MVWQDSEEKMKLAGTVQRSTGAQRQIYSLGEQSCCGGGAGELPLQQLVAAARVGPRKMEGRLRASLVMRMSG